MAGRDFDSFADTPDEFAALTEEQQAALFDGKTIEFDVDAAGDESTDADAGADAEGAQPAAVADQEPSASDKELAETREQARFWKQMAEQRRTEQVDSKSTADDPDQPAEIDIEELEMLLDDAKLADDAPAVADLRKQIREENERRAEARVTERIKAELLAERQAEKDAAIRAEFDAEARRVWAEHPTLDHNKAGANPRLIAKVTAVRNLLIESEGMSPAAALKAAVEDVMGSKPADDPKPAALTAEQKAAAAIAKAKKPAPTSMGDIPTASIPYHDEADVVAGMTPAELSAKMDAMTESQREAFIARHT